jgi:hypothetical protein
MKKEKNIRVAVFRPGANPTFEEIANNLPAVQAIVGGYIEMIPLSADGLTATLNEEGKLHGLTPNRQVAGPAAQDLIVGTFFVSQRCGAQLASLKPEDEARLARWTPEEVWATEKGAIVTRHAYEIWSNVTVSVADNGRHGDYIATMDGYRPGAYMYRSAAGAIAFRSDGVDDMLESLFHKFNQDDRSNRHVAHSLSVGDVVLLDSTAYAVERSGWRKLDEFLPDGPHPANWKNRRTEVDRAR